MWTLHVRQLDFLILIFLVADCQMVFRSWSRLLSRGCEFSRQDVSCRHHVYFLRHVRKYVFERFSPFYLVTGKRPANSLRRTEVTFA